MRVYNFSAGPAVLPEEVLKQAASEMLEYGSSGMSVMEMSHRSAVYIDIFERAQQSLRRVMGLSDKYKILFLQGGASMQFAMVPMNYLKSKASYVVSGNFAKKAFQEAGRFGDAVCVASSADDNFNHIPALPAKVEGDYLHITTNNTIFGTSYRSRIPDAGIPLIGDMSSNILSEELPLDKFALIYAGAQKNIGPAGLTVVIIREDMIKEPDKTLPSMLDYGLMAKNDSMYNTPPTYAVYIAGLVFEHLERRGGIKAVQQQNEHKAKMLYDFLDESAYFTPTAKKEDRSIMNVTFVAGSPEANAAFCDAARHAGLVNLKGHRLVGGMRASIYNAMPTEGVRALVDFMKKYEAEHK